MAGHSGRSAGVCSVSPAGRSPPRHPGMTAIGPRPCWAQVASGVSMPGRKVKQRMGSPVSPHREGGDSGRGSPARWRRSWTFGRKTSRGVADRGPAVVPPGRAGPPAVTSAGSIPSAAKAMGARPVEAGVPLYPVRPCRPAPWQSPVHGLLHQSVAVTVGGQRHSMGVAPWGPGCIASGVLAVHRRLDQVIHLRWVA